MPVWIMILDGIGSLILGLGMAAHFADVNLIPETLQVEEYGLKMMVIGGVFYIPALIFVLKKAITRGTREI